jgi:hypothetical protein
MLTRERTSGRKPVSLFEMISVISSTESRRSSQLLQACRALLIEQVELMTQFVTCGMWHTGAHRYHEPHQGTETMPNLRALFLRDWATLTFQQRDVLA